MAQAKSVARKLLTADPLYSHLQRIAWRSDPITILTYHTLGDDREVHDAWTVVKQSDFCAQLDYVRRHYDVVSLDEALYAPARSAQVRRPRAVLTFDDGHTGLHEFLLPIIEREQLPVTVYVATGHIETGKPYWFDCLMNALQCATPHTVDLSPFGGQRVEVGSASSARNWAAISHVLETLKAQPPQLRDEATSIISSAAQVVQSRRFTPLLPMSRSQLVELSLSRWVTLGAHTHDHALLDQVPLESAEQSIRTCVELLTQWTGRSIHHFAYPNGNCSQSLSKLVKSMGFRSAVSTRVSLWTQGQPVYEMPRVPVGRYDDMTKFKLRLLGKLS